MVDRTGNTILSVEKNLSKSMIRQKIIQKVEGKVTIFTDDYTIYDDIRLRKIIRHYRINHSRREYARGWNHINRAENRHSFIEGFLFKYRGINKDYAQHYLSHLQLILNKKCRWFEIVIFFTPPHSRR